MRKLILSLALLGLAAAPAAAQSIGGTYTVAGTNFDGSAWRRSHHHADQRDDLRDPLGNRWLIFRRHLHAQR
ncbi:hypothetical protein NKJ11_19890 [Mesorhizobium sp. M0243]